MPRTKVNYLLMAMKSDIDMPRDFTESDDPTHQQRVEER